MPDTPIDPVRLQSWRNFATMNIERNVGRVALLTSDDALELLDEIDRLRTDVARLTARKTPTPTDLADALERVRSWAETVQTSNEYVLSNLADVERLTARKNPDFDRAAPDMPPMFQTGDKYVSIPPVTWPTGVWVAQLASGYWPERPNVAKPVTWMTRHAAGLSQDGTPRNPMDQMPKDGRPGDSYSVAPDANVSLPIVIQYPNGSWPARPDTEKRVSFVARRAVDEGWIDEPEPEEEPLTYYPGADVNGFVLPDMDRRLRRLEEWRRRVVLAEFQEKDKEETYPPPHCGVIACGDRIAEGAADDGTGHMPNGVEHHHQFVPCPADADAPCRKRNLS